MSAVPPRIIQVLVVVPPRTLLLDVAGPVEVLRRANQEQGAVRFEVGFAGPQPQVISSVGLLVSGIAPLPAHVPDASLVLLAGDAQVPLNAGAMAHEDGDEETRLVEWLRRTIRPEHRLVCICSGALLAGRAGLLDGYQCTTHHACCAELAAAAPQAQVLENRLYVEDRNRLTSAGITAGVDLMLHLVEGLAGPACAVAVARFLVVYLRRTGADPQLSPWLDGRNHLHPAIHRVQDAIAAAPARAWAAAELARIAHASPRNLSRLFNGQTGFSIPEYVSRLRVALAQDLLSQTRLDMEGVAERAGFGSARQMRRAWGRLHAGPPRNARTLTPAP